MEQPDKKQDKKKDIPARTVQEALVQLMGALADVGILLPSLRVDPVSATHTDTTYALLDLGRCNLHVANQLTAALRRAGKGGPE